MEFFFKVNQFPIERPHVDQVKVDVIGGFARNERGSVHHHGVRVRGDSNDGGGWREHRKTTINPELSILQSLNCCRNVLFQDFYVTCRARSSLLTSFTADVSENTRYWTFSDKKMSLSPMLSFTIKMTKTYIE